MGKSLAVPYLSLLVVNPGELWLLFYVLWCILYFTVFTFYCIYFLYFIIIVSIQHLLLPYRINGFDFEFDFFIYPRADF